MRVCKRRLLSLLLAAVMLCACIPSTALAAETVDAAPPSTPADTLALPSYYQYQKATSLPQAAAPIELTVDGAALSKDDATLTEYLSRTAIRLSPAGYAEWTITVPADAVYTVLPDYAAESGIGQTLELMLTVDGEYPFREATGLSLKRLWKDATAIQQRYVRLYE